MPGSGNTHENSLKEDLVPVLGAPVFPEQGLLPVIVQDDRTGEVLMLAWCDQTAFQKTVDGGLACFFSRSRQEYWVKGETSGNYLKVSSIHVDCDQDAILFMARPHGPTCHRQTRTCFQQAGDERRPHSFGYLRDLEETISHRLSADDQDSYVASLGRKGLSKMLGKIGEEAMELAHAANSESSDRVASEAADLLFHLLVLLQYKNTDLARIAETLRMRDGVGGLEEKRQRTDAV